MANYILKRIKAYTRKIGNKLVRVRSHTKMIRPVPLPPKYLNKEVGKIPSRDEIPSRSQVNRAYKNWLKAQTLYQTGMIRDKGEKERNEFLRLSEKRNQAKRIPGFRLQVQGKVKWNVPPTPSNFPDIQPPDWVINARRWRKVHALESRKIPPALEIQPPTWPRPTAKKKNKPQLWGGI